MRLRHTTEHVGQLTNKIQRSLKQDFTNVLISFKNVKIIGNMLPQVKDPVEKLNRSNVIYRIACADCSAGYVGMSSNQMWTRLVSHRSCFNRLWSLWKRRKKAEDEEIATLRERTALPDHSIGHYQTFDFGNTQILDSSRKKPNLPTLETCHIINTPSTVKYTLSTDTTDNLSSTYADILHTLRNNSRAEQQTHGTHASAEVVWKWRETDCISFRIRHMNDVQRLRHAKSETWKHGHQRRLPSQVQKNAHHVFQWRSWRHIRSLL